MKRKLRKVLNLGQLATTPASERGVHFIAKVVDFGDRKEIVICCPKNDDCSYKILLKGNLRNELKDAFFDGLFVLIEKKGPIGSEIYKLKDYCDQVIWDENQFYVPQLRYSASIDLLPVQELV